MLVLFYDELQSQSNWGGQRSLSLRNYKLKPIQLRTVMIAHCNEHIYAVLSLPLVSPVRSFMHLSWYFRLWNLDSEAKYAVGLIRKCDSLVQQQKTIWEGCWITIYPWDTSNFLLRISVENFFFLWKIIELIHFIFKYKTVKEISSNILEVYKMML